jgi:hypothetical protein
MPVAKPRSFAGNHAAVIFAAVGQHGASPTASNARIATSAAIDPTTPVNQVDHADRVRTLRTESIDQPSSGQLHHRVSPCEYTAQQANLRAGQTKFLNHSGRGNRQACTVQIIDDAADHQPDQHMPAVTHASGLTRGGRYGNGGLVQLVSPSRWPCWPFIVVVCVSPGDVRIEVLLLRSRLITHGRASTNTTPWTS